LLYGEQCPLNDEIFKLSAKPREELKGSRLLQKSKIQLFKGAMISEDEIEFLQNKQKKN